jgi:tetratricopeptide (TPR) repeat protein
MIARNAAELIPTALDPFEGKVDEIAIVLGGISSDDTPAVAEQYATLPVEPFAGKVDEDGKLMHFGDARQQSFDILARAGCEYAVVVDTDDRWEDIHNLALTVEQLDKGNFGMVLFPYAFDGGTFLQPRIYRISSGYWDGPCHNFWEFHKGDGVGLKSDLMHLTQVRKPGDGKARRMQNIRISQEWMAENGDNCRLLLHMAKDLLVDRRIDESKDALTRYFVAYETDERQDPEELYNAYHTMATLLIQEEDFAGSLFNALKALAVRPHGQTWTLAAEAAGWMAHHAQTDRSIMSLALFCADQALAVGRPRSNLHWHSDKLTGPLPLFLKARALCGLGRLREARGALDQALLMEPDYHDAKLLLRDVSRQLGDLE